MNSALDRNLILGRIRDILGERQVETDADHRAIVREYRQEPTLDAAARLELFVDRLVHYQVGVHRCEPSALRRTVAEALAARGKRELVAPAGLPENWMPAEVHLVQDARLSYEALDRSQGVVTGCTLGIAETGTLVLTHGAGEGRRAITLVPDYHLCVVFADQVVQTVPEALRRLAANGVRMVTTISGPSATADIEMTRIKGVHGPRTLDVVIVEKF